MELLTGLPASACMRITERRRNMVPVPRARRGDPKSRGVALRPFARGQSLVNEFGFDS